MSNRSRMARALDKFLLGTTMVVLAAGSAVLILGVYSLFRLVF